MKENKKNITSGDILEMMVRAGLKPEREERTSEPQQRIEPIISINGKDVQWQDRDSEGRAKKDRAA